MNIGLYYARVVSSGISDYYMIVAMGIAVILSRTVIFLIEVTSGIVISGMVQTKINQIGACITLLILASFRTTDVTVAGAIVGIALYTFFVSSKSDSRYFCRVVILYDVSGLIVVIPLRTVEILGLPNHLNNVAVQYCIIG